jgi:hypothetical protein
MAELTAYQGDIPAFPAQLDSVSMPQSVRMNAMLDTGTPGDTRHFGADVPGGHRPAGIAAFGVAEQQLACDPGRLACAEPGADHDQGVIIDADRPGFAALAEPDPDSPGAEIDIARPQRESFGAPQPGTPQHDQQGTVPHPGQRVTRARLQQRADLSRGQRFRRPVT